MLYPQHQVRLRGALTTLDLELQPRMWPEGVDQHERATALRDALRERFAPSSSALLREALGDAPARTSTTATEAA
jgi:hypothetical protein